MRRIVFIAVLASVLMNILATVWLRGSFGHWLLTLVIALYLGAPAAAIAVCAYLLRHRFRVARWLAPIAFVVAVVSASLPVSLFSGRELALRDIAAAKAYCESMIPGIEQYRRTHEAYPPDLSSIARSGTVPRLLRSPLLYYRSDGKEFGFDFVDPRGMMNFIGYSSQTRRWSEWQ